jgi:putative peptidoglycan lipid II flippase
VRAGVPADLDDIACRALAGVPRRGGAPLRSPAEVAAALAVSANGNGGSTSGLPAIGVDDAADGDAPGRFAAPAEPSRTARTARTVAAVVLAAGLALAGWQLLVAVVDGDDGPVRPDRGSPVSSPSAAVPAPTGTVLRPVSAQDFDPPPGNGEEYPDRVDRAVDGDPATSWRTMSYKNRPNLGGAKEGVGLLLDLGTERRVTSVTLQLEGRGTALEIRGGATKPTVAGDLALLASEPAAGPLVTLPLDSGRQVRWLLVWLTKLPAGDRADEYRGGISEITVRS